jgi:hypothetical protein
MQESKHRISNNTGVLAHEQVLRLGGQTEGQAAVFDDGVGIYFCSGFPAGGITTASSQE